MFDWPGLAGCASDRLFTFHQGQCSVAEYVVEFSTLGAESVWDVIALQAAFRRGLNGQLRDALVSGARNSNPNPPDSSHRAHTSSR